MHGSGELDPQTIFAVVTTRASTSQSRHELCLEDAGCKVHHILCRATYIVINAAST